MRVNGKVPVLLPEDLWPVLDGISKAALMDLVWDYAVTDHGEEADVEGTAKLMRKRLGVVLHHRKQQEG